MAASPLLILLLLPAIAADTQPPAFGESSGGTISFRPSIAIIVGIFSVMFSLTFLLLMYAKFCHNAASRNGRVFVNSNSGPLFSAEGCARTSSGIDRAVIESLPFFRFSALRGDRGGLECAVCLSRFDDAEVLRLLPKCKHAFHADCVDRWLESHSTCPLCRHRVDAADAAVFTSSASTRFLFRDHSARRANDDATTIELFIEREPDSQLLHKHKHRIVASGAAFKSRWSDLNSADLVSLDAEMLRAMITSKRFGAVEETERKNEVKINEVSPSRSALLSPGAKRCMSEMTSVPRFKIEGEEDEKVRRVWLPIAQQTLQWFAGRERRPEYEKKNAQEEVEIVP